MLWSGFVSRVGASQRVNVIGPFPLNRIVQGKLLCRLPGSINTGLLINLCYAPLTNLREGPDPLILFWVRKEEKPPGQATPPPPPPPSPPLLAEVLSPPLCFSIILRNSYFCIVVYQAVVLIKTNFQLKCT